MKPSETKVGMRVCLTANGEPHFGTVQFVRYGGCSVRFDDGESSFYQDTNDPWARFEVVES